MKKLYCLLLVFISLIWTSTSASAQEAYAALSENNTVLTFYYDTNKESRNGMSVGPFTLPTDRGWDSVASNITSVIFDKSFANSPLLTSTRYWFMKCVDLTLISGMENLDTSMVWDMSYMFANCTSLQSLDLSGFNTSNVTDMSGMFSNCSCINLLSLNSFNTSNVTNMSYMFSGCNSLTSLEVSKFITSKVTDMEYMFSGCSSLTLLDLSDFNTSEVANTENMFSGCSSLAELNLSSLNTGNVTSMYAMFSGCSSLTSLDLSNFTTFNVTNMGSMFSGCCSLTSLDLSDFDTSNVTYMVSMFSGCSSLTSLNLSSFNTSQVKAMSSMFRDCSSLTSLDVSNFNTSNVQTMFGLFSGCVSLTSIDLRNFKTANVNKMGSMFKNCKALTSLDISNFNTSSVPDMSYMFSGCSSLTSLNLNNFKTAGVTNMKEMFSDCRTLTSLDVSSFNTSKVTNMEGVFSGCCSLETIFGGQLWNTHSVKSSSNMFANCTELVGGLGTTYNASNTDVSYARIDGGLDAPGYFCDKNSLPVASYAVLSNGGKTVTFYYDTQKAKRTGVVKINQRYIDKGDTNAYGTVTTAVIDASFADYRPTSTAYWFMECTELVSISGLEYLNMSNVTDMGSMFSGCTSLTSLDLSNLNTSKVTHMSTMFYGCSSLTSLNLCNFNTSNVTSFGGMFWNCSSLTSLDLSNFNTSNEVIIWYMFYGCSSLKTIYVGDEWTTDAVTEGSAMFANCPDLVGGAGTAYDANHTDAEYARIDGGTDAPGYFTDKNAPKYNVTLTAKNYTREYGEANTKFEYEVSDGAITSGTPVVTCSATATSPVGTYDIVISKGSVTNNEVSLVNGTLTITKAPLTISCGGYTIEQGEALPDFALEYSGWKNDDTEDVLTTKPTVTCEVTKDSEPGTYDIIVSGAEAQNYEISYVAGKLTITARKDNVTLTAKNYTREYGEENPVFEYEVTEGTITSGTPEITCEATASSPVGTYDIIISKGTVSNNGTVEMVKGTLTITKAPLIISVESSTKEEGEDNPEFTLTYNGFKNGETEDVLSKQPTITTTATKESSAGEYDVKVSGAEAQNYGISYRRGTLTITAKPIEIVPVEEETKMNTEDLGGQDLSDNVVNDVYYNVGDGGYDATDQSIVISQTTNMGQIADKEPGSKDVRDNFNGMILKVAKGKGLITVNVKTSGNAQLVVQVGNGTPMLASKTEKGNVVFSYDVEEDTYVYIYAIIGSSAAKGYGFNAADTDSSVRIYSITVSPGTTGIRSIGSSEKNDDIIYDLQGRRVKNTAKGVYIVGGRKYSVK